MTALAFLSLVALIALCLVYLFVAIDAALDRRAKDWVRAVDEWERARRRL